MLLTKIQPGNLSKIELDAGGWELWGTLNHPWRREQEAATIQEGAGVDSFLAGAVASGRGR